MRNLAIIIGSLLLLGACSPQKKEEKTSKEKTPSLLDSVQNAHQLEQYHTHEAISFRVTLFRNGNTRLDAEFNMRTDGSQIVMYRKDGAAVYYDGEEVYMHPDSAKTENARFHVLTWPYFFALPYKLQDPGTQWEDEGHEMLNGTVYRVGKLTFTRGTGDAPDDWYRVYIDPETKKVHAAAYIVTYFSDPTQASKDPHAIVYHDYKEVKGIPLAHRWSFHSWNPDTGLTDTLSTGKLSGFTFPEATDDAFNFPANAAHVPLPGR